MKKPPEIIPGDKSVRLNLAIFLAVYILLLLMIEPVLDYILLMGVNAADMQSMQLVNRQKLVIGNMIYSGLRILPMVFFVWLGYRVLASAQLPPARMKFPFSVILIKGRMAKMMGVLLISVSLLLISQEMVYLARQMVQ